MYALPIFAQTNWQTITLSKADYPTNFFKIDGHAIRADMPQFKVLDSTQKEYAANETKIAALMARQEELKTELAPYGLGKATATTGKTSAPSSYTKLTDGDVAAVKTFIDGKPKTYGEIAAHFKSNHLHIKAWVATHPADFKMVDKKVAVKK